LIGACIIAPVFGMEIVPEEDRVAAVVDQVVADLGAGDEQPPAAVEVGSQQGPLDVAEGRIGDRIFAGEPVHSLVAG
jgi:hypothetical protein